MVGSATNRLCQFWQYACVCVWECECAFWNLNGQYVDMSTFMHARLRTHTHTLRIMGGRNLLRPHPLTAKETPTHLWKRSTNQDHYSATSATPAPWFGQHLAVLVFNHLVFLQLAENTWLLHGNNADSCWSSTWLTKIPLCLVAVITDKTNDPELTWCYMWLTGLWPSPPILGWPPESCMGASPTTPDTFSSSRRFKHAALGLRLRSGSGKRRKF